MISTVLTWTNKRRIQFGLVALILTAVLTVSLVGPVMAEVSGCQELIANGNMENTAGWNVQTNGPYTLFSDFQARTGQRAAYLAGVNSAEDTLRQTVTLPASQQAILSFWWLINTEESSDGWDGLTVQLASADGTPQRVLFAASDRSAGYSWQQTTIDLSEYAGQTIQLLIQARTDATLSTDFFVDDLSLLSCNIDEASGTFFLPLLRR